MKRDDRNELPHVGSLYQIGGEGLTHPLDANTFVIAGDYPVMIEAGSRYGYEALKRRLGELCLNVDDIELVLATHGDWDHVSGMELMPKESDAELFVPSEDRAAVESGDSVLTEAVFYGEEASPIKVAGEVDDGFRLKLGDITVSAIKTPWHTVGSVCYRIDQPDSSTLIGGDTLFGWYFLNRVRNLQDDMRQGKDSLGRLRAERGLTHIAIGHSMRGFRPNAPERLEDCEKQFAPIDLSPVVEKAIEQSEVYINPWIKLPGRSYKY